MKLIMKDMNIENENMNNMLKHKID